MDEIKKILKEEIETYKSWKAHGFDEDYCYDEIHQIFNKASRGTLLRLMEILEK